MPPFPALEPSSVGLVRALLLLGLFLAAQFLGLVQVLGVSEPSAAVLVTSGEVFKMIGGFKGLVEVHGCLLESS